MFLACSSVLFSTCACTLLIPPRALYVGILIVGTIIFAGIPLVIYSFRRKSWADPKAVAEFEPFSWEQKK